MQVVVNVPEDLRKMIFEDGTFDVTHSYRLASCVRKGIPLSEGGLFSGDMSLDEAIGHCLLKAAENEDSAKKYSEISDASSAFSDGGTVSCRKRADNCLACAKQHRQLAAWLIELKNLQIRMEDDWK